MARLHCIKTKLEFYINLRRIIVRSVTRTVLIAEDGMIITNGETFGRTVYLAEGADASEWHEVPDGDRKEGELT